MQLAAALAYARTFAGRTLPSTGRKTCGSAGRKCPHTASKPLSIHKVFSAAFSLSASISAPAELLHIGQPWIFKGILFFWTQAGCRPPGQRTAPGWLSDAWVSCPSMADFCRRTRRRQKCFHFICACEGTNSASFFDRLKRVGGSARFKSLWKTYFCSDQMREE